MAASRHHEVSVVRVRFERQADAFGIGTPVPRLSWMTETAAGDWRQAAYEIEVRTGDGAALWSSGRVDSDRSVFVPWSGPPLRSRQRCTARVRVWGSDGSASPWSEPAALEAGLFELSDWTARFVGPPPDEDASEMQPCPMLRREFTVRGGVERARLYVSALGVYEAEINGVRVGDHVLAPGWTSYHHRLRYQTFDVTPLVREGANAIGAILGDGWFRGRVGFGGGSRNIYGHDVALLAQLEIIYADGSTQVVATDESWRSASGPLLSSGIYEGETYDARLERDGWPRAGYDDADWAAARLVEYNMHALIAPVSPPVRRTELLPPREIVTSPSGKTILDFGQNLVGRLRIAVSGPAGTTITLRHAEVLEDGELCTRPLRGAQATDRYRLRGTGVETWEPRFTFHGFRYAEVDGWPGRIAADSIKAVVCHTDMERTGWFECSDELVNRLHENIVWSMRGNFLDVPTDCPQRDERLGWTGDINVFSPTACFLYDAGGFLASWLADLAADQYDDGTVPFVIPDALAVRSLPTACWGDAAVIVPWVLYERYADREVLDAQYDSMRRWVDHVADLAGEARLWDAGFQFGDWLDPAAPPDRPRDARTDTHLVATACLVHSADVLSQIAAVLGRDDDGARYERLAREVREAFAREYVTPAGRLAADTQTAYALALRYALLPAEAQRRRAAERLARLVHQNQYRIGTGFVGTPLICDALCDAGKSDLAYRMLLERACPSWLFPVTM
ncbi:MAG: family 78 glycoside hydrolase catalytic domain, partial [Chloroflexi bacterium]|nr:family 78 glycoside hydrolase catalytic domain [Chloroflexota bacterium]